MCQKLDRSFPSVRSGRDGLTARLPDGILLPFGRARPHDRAVRAVRRGRRWEATAVPDSEAKRFGALPSATGGITRLAYARAQAAGVNTDPLLKLSLIHI